MRAPKRQHLGVLSRGLPLLSREQKLVMADPRAVLEAGQRRGGPGLP